MILEVVGESAVGLRRGDGATLSVKTAAGAAVTFLSLDGGVFGNGLSTVSVQANRRGTARATLYADAGMEGAGTVRAASPEAVGVVEFLVEVLEDGGVRGGVPEPGR